MVKIYKIKDIKLKNIYNLQGKMIHDIVIVKENLIIASILFEDIDKKRIEIIAFGEAAKQIIKKKLKKGSFYEFKRLRSQVNDKYKKTNHECKLIFGEQSSCSEIKHLEYMKNGKIFISIDNEKKEIFKNKRQLSMKCFVNKKKK